MATVLPRLNAHPRTLTLMVVLGVLVVSLVDYSTGIEVRAFPLYFLPLVAAAWWFGLAGAVLTSLLFSLSWLLAMYVGGREYSQDWIWGANTLAQFIAFLTVSGLVARLRLALQRERELSRTDGLTGLWNSRAFAELAEDRLAVCRRHRRPATLAYVDLDNFKQVNDRLGHADGDRLLQATATAMREAFRKSDLIARVGGDEFIVLLPETDAEQAYAALEKLRSRLAGSPAFLECGVTASIGALNFSQGDRPLSEMIRAADAVMYRVKAASKNKVVVEDDLALQH